MMVQKTVCYVLWGFFYLLCGFLGLITPQSGAQAGAMTALSLAFFLPPAVLLILAYRENNKNLLRQLRLISILSLALTLLVFVLNIAAVGASETTGKVLYYVLTFVSVPMVCSQHYVVSLFLWACLLFSTFPALIRKKK